MDCMYNIARGALGEMVGDMVGASHDLEIASSFALHTASNRTISVGIEENAGHS